MSSKRLYVALIMLPIMVLGGCFGVHLIGTNGPINIKNLEGKTNIMPVAIIGSGPAGLMAAIYCARGGKEAFIIEGNKPGGLLMDTTEVENWPGSVTIKGSDIIENLRKQALNLGVHFIEDAVERIEAGSWPYVIRTEGGSSIHAMSIVVATGASPRKLGIPGEQEYWGAGVTACAVCDAPFYRNEEVVVVGGGDSAIEEAVYLTFYAKKVTILVRKDRMRAAAQMQERLSRSDRIQVLYNVEVRRVLGDGQKLTGVELYNAVTGQVLVMNVGGLFLAIGHIPNSYFVKGIVKTDSQGYIQLKPGTQETSVTGIFAAGDVADFKYRQAGTAAGYGIAAGLEVVSFLDQLGFTRKVAAQYSAQFFKPSQIFVSNSKNNLGAIHYPKNAQQFAETTAQKGTVVFLFYAQTCPVSEKVLPIYQSLACNSAPQATFGMVDMQRAPDIAANLFVHKTPTLLVFKDGNLVVRYAGFMGKSELNLLIEQANA